MAVRQPETRQRRRPRRRSRVASARLRGKLRLLSDQTWRLQQPYVLNSRARNERAQRDDTIGGIVLATLWLAVAAKTWLGGQAGADMLPQRRIPFCTVHACALPASPCDPRPAAGLALVPALYAGAELAMAVAVALTSRFHSAYVRWRELIYIEFMLHGLTTVLALSEPGRKRGWVAGGTCNKTAHPRHACAPVTIP